MKVLILSPKGRYDLYAPDCPSRREAELIFRDRTGTEEEWLAAGADAQVLVVTPVTHIRRELIGQMPNLRLIQCDGVGFDRIDLEAARQRGIYVCNNAGCNAGAVAELAVTLMSMLLHRTLWGDQMMKAGLHSQATQTLERNVPPDLSVSHVGLVGLGHIALATAQRLRVNGSRVSYYARHRRTAEEEAALGVSYLPLYELAEQCDVISLHLPATAESRHLLDREFFAHVKPGAFLVNTARGAIIDDDALCQAVRSGRIAGVALDAYEPEPAGADHPLVRLAAEFPDRIILCPHQGGVSQAAFRNAVRMVFENLDHILAGERPERVINGL